VAGVLFAVAVQLAFNGGTIVSFLYPLGALVLSTVGALAVHYVTTAFERERVRDLFARFVPENVVDDVLARTDEGLRIGGVQRDGTVMFTDLRGFTSFAESLPPERVIAVLNNYLSGMSDTILNHGGTLVAYMGDGIMAVFGAPIEQNDHADRALRAAREMLWERLPAFNEWIKSEGLGEGFRMGIGLNSGDVMSGNVGSERRLEYTAIGDTTNTASRLEGMTKGTPHQLFVADATRARLNDPAPDLVSVGEFEVRGREATVKLWSLPDAPTELGDGVAQPPEGAERASE
jgi:adenylate cyclase